MRTITVGLACNNACVFCAQGDLRKQEAAPRDVTAAIAAISAGEVAAFLGGEPTLHDDLPAWIRAAEARGASRIVVQTNGRRLAYKSYAHALHEASAKVALDVSLQGATAIMHEYHTGVPQSFAQTVQGIRNARAERIPVGVTVVITRSSFRHLVEIARVAHTAGATAIHFAPAASFGRAARDQSRVLPAADMVAPYLSRAVTEARRLRLAVAVGDRAVTADAADLFAGLGEVEPIVAEVSPPVRKRVSLPVASDHDGPVSPDAAGEEQDSKEHA